MLEMNNFLLFGLDLEQIVLNEILIPLCQSNNFIFNIYSRGCFKMVSKIWNQLQQFYTTFIFRQPYAACNQSQSMIHCNMK